MIYTDTHIYKHSHIQPYTHVVCKRMDIYHVLCLSASLPLFRALTLSLTHALTSSLTRTRRGKIPSTRILVHSILHAGNAACTIIADGVVSVKLDEVCGAVGLEVAGVVVLLIDDVGAGLVGGGVVTKVSMLQSAPVQPSSQMQVPSHPRHCPCPTCIKIVVL